MGAEFRPLIVGIGGTTRTGSASEKALRCALRFAEEAGAKTEILAGPSLNVPMYAPDSAARAPEAERLVSALRRTHGVILSSPGYHGSISGMLKNALDYIEDMRKDAQPYLEGRAVGLIACASGWQATGSTLAALRSIVHALRGWPTPLGVAINSAGKVFDDFGAPVDPAIAQQLRILAGQVVEFARMRSLHDESEKSGRRARSK